FLAGPNGNGGVARIGGAAAIGDPNFDYYDSGVSVPAGGTANARVLCIEVADDTAMTITYGATTVVGGGSGVVLNAFVNSLDEVRHESENILSGTSNSFFVDDLALTCTSLPLVTLPSLTLTYLDELEWANVGVTIHANDDDGDPSTPFRWSSVGNMPVVSLAGESNVLRMQNLFADTPQTPGGFTLFPQASTQLPNVAVSPDRGYAAGASFKFTDGLTTRAWVVAEAGAAPGLYRWNTALLYSAGTGTFWALTPDAADPIQNDPAWFDTGRSLASLGISLSEWFTLTIHHNLDGTFTFKINASILTDAGGSIVRVDPLQSVGGGLHNNLDRLHFISGDDLGGANSILYTDNIRAWALPCAGDTNDDGVVNFADINNILGAFNSAASVLHPANVAPDDNGDGVADDEVVNFADLNAALSRFHSTCD
ncbi:MAG: hypothetical protein IBJ10_11815, partial [Phycisphaerales bacterium]|nr:hypothetical protein [Phycisphaerales bacterium]